jgi:hypothetical protein
LFHAEENEPITRSLALTECVFLILNPQWRFYQVSFDSRSGFKLLTLLIIDQRHTAHFQNRKSPG